MKLESRADGWHILHEDGRDFGPFASLDVAQDMMDLLENQQAATTKQPNPRPLPNPPLAGPSQAFPTFEG
jgi:hypothetical protein